MSTLYAAFTDAAAAERAAGALLDNGAREADVSVLANESLNATRAARASVDAAEAEGAAKSGISTTTPGDVAAGAVKGASIGVGLGALAVVASIFIPGLGLVLGGGALASALAGGAATVLAGAAAGGVVGYLKDQGVDAEMATRYNAAFEQGGAILAIAVPTGNLPTAEVEHILVKYGATNVATYNNPIVANPNGIPAVAVANTVVETPVVPVVESVAVPSTLTHTIVDAETGDATVVRTAPPSGVIDPMTGTMVAPTVAPVSGVAIDPVTGGAIAATSIDAVTGRPMYVEDAVYVESTSAPAIDPVTGLAITPPAAVPVAPIATGVVVDPVTGVQTPATVAEGYAGEALVPVEEDVVIQNADGSTTIRRDVELL